MKPRHVTAATWIQLGSTLGLLWGLVLSSGRSPALLAQAGPEAGEWTVCPAGPPVCDYSVIQAAVDAAGGGDVVKVAAGVYDDVNDRGGLSQVVFLTKTLTLRGGYAAPDFAEPPNPEANPTILDALEQGRVLYINGNIAPTIEGLRLTGGNAAGLGGGNAAEAGDGAHSADSLLLRWKQIYGSTDSDINGVDAGGGVYSVNASPLFRQNQVYGNTAFAGGGLALFAGHATLTGNAITANSGQSGGGLYLALGAPGLDGNTIAGNQALGGGGLELWDCDATLQANVVTGNIATGSQAGQGAGGLSLVGRSDATLVNNVIAGNQSANLAGGMSVMGSAADLQHNTIARNTGSANGILVTSASYPWGTDYSTVTLVNTIVEGHTVGLAVTAGNAATLDSTLWYGNGANWSGTINHHNDHSGNPAFVNPGGGDYHLGPASAAIDAGVYAGIATDIDGQNRPSGAGYDIGADEFQTGPVLSHVVFLPMVHRQYPLPPNPPSLLILDKYGGQRDWDWVIQKFGAVTMADGDGSAAVRILQEVEGPATLVAHVERDGRPLVGYPVMVYWADAPVLDPALRACGKDRADVVYTKDNGNAEFSMGFGSYYFPPDGGPHVVWVGGPGSDCLGGLGMLGLTNHIHLDSQWEVP